MKENQNAFDDAARQQLLRDQKFLNRARQLRLDWLSIGGD
jgi:hypothetical protein